MLCLGSSQGLGNKMFRKGFDLDMLFVVLCTQLVHGVHKHTQYLGTGRYFLTPYWVMLTAPYHCECNAVGAVLHIQGLRLAPH